MEFESHQWRISAQQAQCIVDSFGMSVSENPHKLHIQNVLFEWADAVLPEEQKALILHHCKSPENKRLIPLHTIRFALQEPAAAEAEAISLSVTNEDLEELEPNMVRHIAFINLMAERNAMHMREDYAADGIDENDQEYQENLFASESHFAAKRNIGASVLLLINETRGLNT